MDFVVWCDFVLKTCLEVMKTLPKARSIGVDEHELAQALSSTLGITNFRRQEEYYKTTYYDGMFDAVKNLRAGGFIENNERSKSHWKVSRLGQHHITDQVPQWFAICQEQIDVEHMQLLSLINRLSPHAASDHAWLESVNHQTIASELADWPAHQIWNVAKELDEWGYVSGFFSAANTVSLEATYKGVVWETRRAFTLESKFIDGLVADWETTSVEFKRDLYTDKAGQVAEFIKDVLSLATTKASGQRWMIIGFDDDTHEYCGSPNPKLTQNHFEQLLQEYTKPMVKVGYQVVDYRKGPVGKMEVFRDAKHLPYKVAKSLGSQNDKRRITEGDIYVRHRSQVQKPTPEELQALQEEGDQARLAP